MDELLSLAPPAWFSRQPIFVNAGHAKLVWNGLAEGTRKGYRSAQRSYTRSCALNRVQPWPATAPAIYTWLTERLLGAGRSPPVKPDTAISELSALHAYHVDNGLSDEIFDLHAKHFRRMIDGARRLQPPRQKTGSQSNPTHLSHNTIREYFRSTCPAAKALRAPERRSKSCRGCPSRLRRVSSGGGIYILSC